MATSLVCACSPRIWSLDSGCVPRPLLPLTGVLLAPPRRPGPRLRLRWSAPEPRRPAGSPSPGGPVGRSAGISQPGAGCSVTGAARGPLSRPRRRLPAELPRQLLQQRFKTPEPSRRTPAYPGSGFGSEGSLTAAGDTLEFAGFGGGGGWERSPEHLPPAVTGRGRRGARGGAAFPGRPGPGAGARRRLPCAAPSSPSAKPAPRGPAPPQPRPARPPAATGLGFPLAPGFLRTQDSAPGHVGRRGPGAGRPGDAGGGAGTRSPLGEGVCGDSSAAARADAAARRMVGLGRSGQMAGHPGCQAQGGGDGSARRRRAGAQKSPRRLHGGEMGPIPRSATGQSHRLPLRARISRILFFPPTRMRCLEQQQPSWGHETCLRMMGLKEKDL
ncbi:translation initiation factor IF-2-like [Choloepus didactylus]|uniref:translation initiation factor IF-2-like n=1 Tax=Choloepus didactylus TaxID=27675 RepID=UPI00189E3B8C|nr:translation initiation factor IF-2-like [Choloepus didactylus]